MQDSFVFDFSDRPDPLASDLLDAPWLQALLLGLGLPDAGAAEPALVAVKPDFEPDRPWPLPGRAP